MAVSEQTPYIEYTANGSTTSFALGFICDSKNDLIVLVDGVAPPVATWSLIGANAVFTTAPASGKKIVLQRNTAMSRTTNYQSNNNSFRPETINKDIDRVWLKLQELGVADMLLKIYVDRLHGEQKDYIDNKDQLVRNIIGDLRNYVNQQDGSLSSDINNLRTYVNQQDNNRNSYFENLISRQGVSLQQLDNYYKHLLQGIANIAADKGWLASLVTDASGKTQQEVNDRKLYFSNFITTLDGSTAVDTQFIVAITAANGREIILQKDEVIKLKTKINLGALNVNIVGEGGEISIEHTEQGVVTSGNVSLSGVIDIDCNKQSWCAFDCTGTGSKVYIGNNVKIKNVYGVTSGIAVRSLAKVNSIHASFDDISALANGIVGDNAGAVRCIYLAGPKSKSIISGNFNNVYNVNGSGVRVDEDADAIHCQDGVHDILLYDADFRNIDKRWLKLQGHAGSRTVVKNITGSSAFTGTPDNISASQNGLYACVSLYAGTLEVDGVTYEGGSCFAFLSVGTSLATKVSLTGIQYHPEYHNYVQGLVTRFVLSEAGCDNLDISMTPSVYATGVHLGVDLLHPTVAINVAGSTISSAGTAIDSRAKNTTVYSAKLSKVGGASGAGYGINIGSDVGVVNVFDNIISGDFQDGVIVPTRTTPLYGQITGNNAPNVTRSVLQLNDLVNTVKLITFGNIGSGITRTNMVSDTYMFKDRGGVVLASVGATGMIFNFESASVGTLSSATTSFNTSNKRVGRPVLNTTDKKLYLATGDTPTSTWVSADGLTVITPT